MELQLTNVITISVSAAQAGVGEYNTSNIAIFTREEAGGGFGDDGYKIYLDPTEIGTDFGTGSVTAQMATAIFSQKPNMLAGNGYLVVIPFEDTADVTAIQTITFSEAPASGGYKLNYDGDVTAEIAFDANAGAIQTAIRTLTGLGAATVAGTAATSIVVTMAGVVGPAELMTVTDNSLQTAEPENVVMTVTTTTPGTEESTETIGAAITRTKDLVQYFGILVAEITSETPLLAAAAIVQTLNKIAFWPQIDPDTVEEGGTIDLLATGNLKQNRGLFYGDEEEIEGILYSARYAGRALSVNFSGSNTTQTMHLKDLIGQQADPSMTQTLLAKCQAAGADVYVSLQGVPKVFCSGANGFFDQVYNVQWFAGALQVAGFNALAQSSTKVAQTEEGIAVLKGAYRKICEQGVTNQYMAPGSWDNPTTFGNQADFFRNIEERGYYIYSAPVATQSSVARAARQAPLIQIAIKEAGAIHSSSVIVYVNA